VSAEDACDERDRGDNTEDGKPDGGPGLIHSGSWLPSRSWHPSSNQPGNPDLLAPNDMRQTPRANAPAPGCPAPRRPLP
jgi:hypothetical protein